MNVCRAVHCTKIIDGPGGWDVITTPPLDDPDADQWFSDRRTAQTHADQLATEHNGTVVDWSTDTPGEEAAELRRYRTTEAQRCMKIVHFAEWLMSARRIDGDDQ